MRPGDFESLGVWLRAARCKLGLSNKELSNMLGVAYSNISNWERGNRRPNRIRCALLAQTFNVPTRDVLVLAGHNPAAGSWEGDGEVKTIREYVVAMLEAGWRGSDRELADFIGCSRTTVYNYRIEWGERRGLVWEKPGRRCTRCQFISKPQNPVGDDGLCLWCRLEMRGVNLLEWHESGEAARAVELGVCVGPEV